MAITLQKENFAKSTLDGGILIGAGSVDIQPGDEALFPVSGPFRAVIWGVAYTTPQDDADREIVEAEVSSSGVSFDITRAQEGTVAKAWSDGDHFALVFTKETIEELETAIEAEHDADGAHAGNALGQLLATDLTLTGVAASPPDSNTIVKDNIIKGWVLFDGTAGTPTPIGSYNVSSITDTGVGDWTVVWDRDFANVNYCVVATAGSNVVHVASIGAVAVGSVQIRGRNVEGSVNVDTIMNVMAIGDQ